MLWEKEQEASFFEAIYKTNLTLSGLWTLVTDPELRLSGLPSIKAREYRDRVKDALSTYNISSPHVIQTYNQTRVLLGKLIVEEGGEICKKDRRSGYAVIVVGESLINLNIPYLSYDTTSYIRLTDFFFSAKVILNLLKKESLRD